MLTDSVNLDREPARQLTLPQEGTMEIEQIINLGKYSVRKTADGTTGQLLSNSWDCRGCLVCCLGCHRGDESEEDHVIKIVTSCRALGITTLIAGRLWYTPVPSVTVIRVLENGEREEIVTDNLEQENFRAASYVIKCKAKEEGRSNAQEFIDEYIRRRKSLYQSCGIPCPIGEINE